MVFSIFGYKFYAYACHECFSSHFLVAVAAAVAFIDSAVQNSAKPSVTSVILLKNCQWM